MDFLDEIKQIDLIRYAQSHYGMKVYPNGKAHCPIDLPDRNPSFHFWRNEDGVWLFKDHHNGANGTIIDFEILMHDCSISEAIRRIAQNENLNSSHNKFYLYRNLDGTPLYWKVREIKQDGTKKWWVKYENGKCEQVPYNLPDSKQHGKAIVCEGEKDADTVKKIIERLELDYWVTSAPNGMSSWPDNINQYFVGMRETTFLYDVGEDADLNVRKHASKLKKTFPEMDILIAHVPLEKEDADITDYLSSLDDKEMALLDILEHAEELVISSTQDQEESKKLQIETLEQFMGRQIPKIEKLVEPFLERNGFTLIGGTKGVGKSLFVTQMALHYASGQSGFLNSTIDETGRVLIIQQEVSESGMQDRLKKMLAEGNFNTQNRFSLKTTTGNQLNLTKEEDKRKILACIDQTKADVLILDPLYTFFPGELNQAKDMSRIISVLLELKSKYNLSLVVVHHFSNKANPDEPRPTVGRFLGHSNLANAADVTIGIDFLHPRYREQVLPFPYNHYASVETMTRHKEWPGRLYIERGANQLLFRISSIWDEIGKKVPPDEIIEFVNACGGEKPQKEVINYFEKTKKAHANTIRKSIDEVRGMGRLVKDPIPGKHNMMMLKIVKQRE